MNPADIPPVSHDWGAIVPEMVLAGGALLLLLLEVVVPTLKRWLPHLTAALFVLLAVGLGWNRLANGFGGSQEFFGGMLRQTAYTDLYRIFFLLTGAAVAHLGMTYLRSRPLARVEFFHVLLVVIASLMLLVQSAHFAMLFVALETLTIGFYILVAYGRYSALSLEAGLKYLVVGSLSSGLTLFGIVLLFGAASNPVFDYSTSQPFHFGALAEFFTAYHRMHEGAQPLLGLVGAGLVISGVAFKIGLVPFQIWIPDVYQGAPTPVTALLAVGSKAGGVFILLNLVGPNGPFAQLEAVTIPLLTLLTAATLLFGNLAALGQRNVKRLMGLSGVAHAGFLILGVLASAQQEWLVPVIFFYLVVYALASFGVFEVMTHVGPPEDADQGFDDYS
ncbi:MAG: NADH-quinone oxidoreductase subunit N, partial [Opitutales bacterium]